MTHRTPYIHLQLQHPEGYIGMCRIKVPILGKISLIWGPLSMLICPIHFGISLSLPRILSNSPSYCGKSPLLGCVFEYYPSLGCNFLIQFSLIRGSLCMVPRHTPMFFWWSTPRAQEQLAKNGIWLSNISMFPAMLRHI